MKFYYPKNSNGEIIGFKTPESQVYDKNGISLTDKLAELNSNKASVVTGTLVSGSTSITLSNSAIKTDSVIDMYTSVYGVNPNSISVSTGSITLTFDSQSSDISIRVEVR